MFYIIDKNTRVLIRQSATPFNINEAIQPPLPTIQLKRVDNNTEPAFNSATQKLTRIFTDNDVNFTRTFSWEVVALSQAELDAKAADAADAATRVQLKAFYTALVNGTGTAAERLTRLEKGLAYVLRNEVK